MIPSPTPHLLGIRCQPTEQEEAAIKAALAVQQEELRKANSQVAKARSVLTSLNTEWEHMILYAFDDNNPKKGALVQVVGEICDAQRHLDTSLQRRNEIQHFVDSHSAIITSMAQWLLPDVLSEIFLQVDRSYPVRTPSHKRMSVTLCHVCRHWRNVAFSTTLLWNTFTDYKLRWDFTKFWIERARDAPLNLRILHSDKFDPELLALYASYRSRWKELSITIPAVTIGLIPPTRDHTPNDVPLLQHLDITILPPPHSTENRIIRAESFPWLQDILSHAPNIRSLTWDGAVIPNSVVWSRLTKVNLRNVTVLQALGVLMELKNVEEFSGGFAKEDMEGIPQNPLRIHSDSLRHLDLNFHRSHKFNIHHVLFSLTLPSLQYLKLTCPSWWPQRALLHLIERSAVNLDELVLVDCKYLKPSEAMELWKSDLLRRCLIRMDVGWYHPQGCNALNRAWNVFDMENGPPPPPPPPPPHFAAHLFGGAQPPGTGPAGGPLTLNLNVATGAWTTLQGGLNPMPPAPNLHQLNILPAAAPPNQGNHHGNHGAVNHGLAFPEQDDPLLSRRARLVPSLKAVLRFGQDVPEEDLRKVAIVSCKTKMRYLGEEFDVYLDRGGPSGPCDVKTPMPILTADSTAEQLVFERVLPADGIDTEDDAVTGPSTSGVEDVADTGASASSLSVEDTDDDATMPAVPFGFGGGDGMDWQINYATDDDSDGGSVIVPG